jgi:hypothetical protein
MRTLSLAFCTLCLLAAGPGAAPLSAQPLEEFVVDSGPPRFGENPLIQGNWVVWIRFPDGDRVPRPGMIQARDIGRVEGPVFDIADKPAGEASTVLGQTHLFWGRAGVVFARRLADLPLGLTGSRVEVCRGLIVVSANSGYVVVAQSEVSGNHFRGTFYAKSVDDLENPSPDALRRIADFEYYPAVGRWVAASDEYFVWIDLDPPDRDHPEATWKIFAKRAEDLFTPGAEFLAVDTGRRYGYKPSLALHGRTLFFEGRLDDTMHWYGGLYLLRLGRGEEPELVVGSWQRGLSHTDPSVSEHYAVWLRMEDFYIRSAHGVRLKDGRADGEPFLISDRPPSWVSVSRNIAVWNGVAASVGGDDISYSVLAAELPLPGAEDLGDADQNGRLDLTDAVVILNWLYLGGWRPRLRPADFDENGAIELADAVGILEHLFAGAPRPR